MTKVLNKNLRARYYVYLLQCKDGSIYTGITNNLEKRLKQHKDGVASRYTRARGTVKMVYTEPHPTRSDALKREAKVKKWRRDKKIDLIKSLKNQ